MFRFMKSPIGIVVGVAAVLIASPKARAGVRKMAVKTVSVFLGNEEKVEDTDSEMKETLPKVKEAVRKVAVKVTSPIIGIVETIQDSISKLQKKWVSPENVFDSEQVINYDGLAGSPH